MAPRVGNTKVTARHLYSITRNLQMKPTIQDRKFVDGSGCHQNSQANPNRSVLGAWIANGIRFAKSGLVRSDSKVFLFKLRRLKTSRARETLLRFVSKARVTRRSRVELNSVRKAPKSPRGVARTKNGPCSNPLTNNIRPKTSPS